MYRLNTKIRLTMLCLSGFELYSRWVPMLKQAKTRLIIILYALLVISKTAHANRRSFTVPALAFIYGRGKVSDILSNHWH